jgi:hypothetical protein
MALKSGLKACFKQLNGWSKEEGGIIHWTSDIRYSLKWRRGDEGMLRRMMESIDLT